MYELGIIAKGINMDTPIILDHLSFLEIGNNISNSNIFVNITLLNIVIQYDM